MKISLPNTCEPFTVHTSTSIKCKHKQNQPVLFPCERSKEQQNVKNPKLKIQFNKEKKKTSSDINADYRSHPPKLYTQSHPIKTSLFHSLSHTHAKLKNSLNHSHLYIATQNLTLFGHFNQPLSLSHI